MLRLPSFLKPRPFAGAEPGMRRPDDLAGFWTTLGGRARRAQLQLTPSQLLVLTFLVLVTVGTLGLRWLPGLYAADVERLGWIDALFTATSAVCVTGLVVVDTATYFTFWGQLWIMILIQLGGLGILGMASIIIVTLNSRLSLRHHALAGHEGLAGGAVGAGGPAAAGNVPLGSLVRDVMLFTLFAEGAGFVLLLGLWWDDFDTKWEAAWHACFNAVSAFCNAGFSTFSDSMEGHNARPLVLMVVMGGVAMGSLGFLTLEELKLWVQGRVSRRAFRLSLHTRLVLVAWGLFLLAGWTAFAVLEWVNPATLGELEVGDKLNNALFMSMMPRTAGFNSVDMGEALPPTKFFTMLLMAVGGAPGGTSGGMKVTTVAIIMVVAYSRLRAKRSTDLWDRTIPATTANRAIGLFAFSFTMVTIGVLLLTITELGAHITYEPEGGTTAAELDSHFIDYMFEAVSAFNTCGLSTGPTGELTGWGRVLLVVLMFIGRVGPLTFAAALSRVDIPGRHVRRYAHEDVVVG